MTPLSGISVAVSAPPVAAGVVSPVGVLTGVPIAVLFGIVTATGVGAVSFLTAARTETSVPPIGGGLATAAITGGLLYTTGVVSGIGPILGIGLAGVLGLYATEQGRQLARTVPQGAVGSIERRTPLAAESIDAVDAMGQVTIRSSGDVRPVEGYPPLDPALRETLETGSWRLPADLPLAALETRLERQLETAYELAVVSATIDRRGRATITAAPPENGVSAHVSDGERAVSVRAVLPTGLTAGDGVRIYTDSAVVSGTVVSAAVDGGNNRRQDTAAHDWSADRANVTAATAGGEGRVTVAVPTIDAETLLAADRARVVVTPLETTATFEAVSLLDRSDVAVRLVPVTDRLVDAIADEETDLDVFAVRQENTADSEWTVDPPADEIRCGMEAIVVGTDTTAIDCEPADAVAGSAEPEDTTAIDGEPADTVAGNAEPNDTAAIDCEQTDPEPPAFEVSH